MFLTLLAGLLLAGFTHARMTRPRAPGETPELLLVYVLAGYCGIVQVAVAIAMLLVPDLVATQVGVPAGNPIEIWAASLLLGAGIIATLSIRFRGSYLIAPVIVWSVFFLGASYAHLRTDILNGRALSPGRVAWTLATHALVSAILIGLFIARRGRSSKTRPSDPIRATP